MLFTVLVTLVIGGELLVLLATAVYVGSGARLEVAAVSVLVTAVAVAALWRWLGPGRRAARARMSRAGARDEHGIPILE